MPRFPQCPRCGDNLSELVMTAWRPPAPDSGPTGPGSQWHERCEDIATRGICSLCATAVTPKPDDTQQKLAEHLSKAVASFVFVSEGLTVRDYFAAAALAAVIEKRSVFSKEIGPLCYAIADQMLAARG